MSRKKKMIRYEVTDSLNTIQILIDNGWQPWGSPIQDRYGWRGQVMVKYAYGEEVLDGGPM